jgi:hypothetical protein
VTTASWKYENGAVGQFTHAVALQGQVRRSPLRFLLSPNTHFAHSQFALTSSRQAYSCEFEVYADGYQLRLQDPYNNPTLLVRRPGDDHEEVHKGTENDDPFFSEVSNWIDCVRRALRLPLLVSPDIEPPPFLTLADRGRPRAPRPVVLPRRDQDVRADVGDPQRLGALGRQGRQGRRVETSLAPSPHL